jgi:hypothetical protein
MSKNLHLVFSRPPEGMSHDEYNRWYDFHLSEILASEGFTAARRFALHTVRGEASPAMYDYLSAYEIEGDPAQVMATLEAHVPSMKLPEWFPRIRFASWTCISLDGRVEPNLVDHAYLVFSTPPDGMSFDDFSRWYATHIDENLTTPGLVSGRRFRLEPEVVDAGAPATASHLALYEVAVDLDEMRRGLDAGIAAGRIHLPDWFAQIRFVSLDCRPIGTRVTAAV